MPAYRDNVIWIQVKILIRAYMFRIPTAYILFEIASQSQPIICSRDPDICSQNHTVI